MTTLLQKIKKQGQLKHTRTTLRGYKVGGNAYCLTHVPAHIKGDVDSQLYGGHDPAKCSVCQRSI